MTLSNMHMIVLKHVNANRAVYLRDVGEPYRQKLIDLGMMEPPLIDVDGEVVTLTDDGRAAIFSSKRPQGAAPPPKLGGE